MKESYNFMKSIYIITSKYPSKDDPAALIFVQQLFWAIADIGIDCTIICPIAYNIEVKKSKNLPSKTIEFTESGKKIKIYYPRFFGFGQRDMKLFNTARLTLMGFSKAAFKIVESLPNKPDVIYGHFISPAGVTAARIGKKIGVPSFLAYGESTPWSIKNLGINFVRKEIDTLSGIISVSSKNKSDLVELGIADKNKIGVFPNAIRASHFYPRNKRISREKLNLPANAFIVSFVGHFIKRKGVDKLVDIINQMDNVYGIFAGKGPILPLGDNVLFSSLVSPEDLPYFYSASDVFVLPTLNEGCCNAIIEAMACGLPIISSDRSFNDDILDESNSIRVNPEDIEEIKAAIKTLYNDKEKLQRLKNGSLTKAKNLTIENRAKKIIDFMKLNL